jgi:hypothetical protein
LNEVKKAKIPKGTPPPPFTTPHAAIKAEVVHVAQIEPTHYPSEFYVSNEYSHF